MKCQRRFFAKTNKFVFNASTFPIISYNLNRYVFIMKHLSILKLFKNNDNDFNSF